MIAPLKLSSALLISMTADALCFGCSTSSQHEDQHSTDSSLLGKNMSQLENLISDDAELRTQDASPTVGMEASFSGQDLESDRWTVVAACADEADIRSAAEVEIAVIPTKKFLEFSDRGDKYRKFDDLVSCTFNE